MPTALITGVTGQDGSILVEKLMRMGYDVYCTYRRSGRNNLGCLEKFTYKNLSPQERGDLNRLEMDITDQTAVIQTISAIPSLDEVYHMAAYTHVGNSYKHPHLCMNVNYGGTLNLLEACRLHCPDVKFIHAATSELFGGDDLYPWEKYDEQSPFSPKTPYGISKLSAYHLCEFYKTVHKMNISQSICFNHESERRGDDFVTKKIINGLWDIKTGKKEFIELGNLGAERDWGCAYEYMDGIITINQSDIRSSFILATGEPYSIKHFLTEACHQLGMNNWESYVKINPLFVRKNEVHRLVGDNSKMKEYFNWIPTKDYRDIIRNMIEYKKNEQ